MSARHLHIISFRIDLDIMIYSVAIEPCRATPLTIPGAILKWPLGQSQSGVALCSCTTILFPVTAVQKNIRLIHADSI